MQVNLLVAIEKQAELACSSFNPQNCANLLWGFAKLGQPTGTLLPAIAKRLKTKDLYLQCKPVEVRPRRGGGRLGIGGNGRWRCIELASVHRHVGTRRIVHTVPDVFCGDRTNPWPHRSCAKRFFVSRRFISARRITPVTVSN